MIANIDVTKKLQYLYKQVDMRDVLITDECLNYINQSSLRIRRKFDYLLEILIEQQIVHSTFVEKIVDTDFYELKIKAENQIRIIMFTVDHQNINQAQKIILIYGFLKRENKDYKKAVEIAGKLLKKYLDEESKA